MHLAQCFWIVSCFLAVVPSTLASAAEVYTCTSNQSHVSARLTFAGSSNFFSSTSNECNGGVGDPMTDCHDVTRSYEQKNLAVAVRDSGRNVVGSFPVIRFADTSPNRDMYFGGNGEIKTNGRTYIVSLLKPELNTKGYRLFVIVFGGDPYKSPVISRSPLLCRSGQ